MVSNISCQFLGSSFLSDYIAVCCPQGADGPTGPTGSRGPPVSLLVDFWYSLLKYLCELRVLLENQV